MKRRATSPLLLFLLVCLCAGSCSAPEKKEVPCVSYYDLPEASRDLDKLVAEAYAQEQIPVVFFSATWCGPCQQFKRALNNTNVARSLQNVQLIMVDVDKDYELENFSAAYNITEIPSFLRIDTQGRVLKKITSASWSTDSPDEIAVVMDGFLK